MVRSTGMRLLLLALLVLSLPAVDISQGVQTGALRVLLSDGSLFDCPLRGMRVRSEINGPAVRTVVEQTFANPFPQAIEAVYVFPLPHTAAVDEMEMRLEGRRVRAELKERAKAEETYAKAVQEGRSAALLTQERPNLFTQKVGNIPPGGEILVRLACCDLLTARDGRYELVLPLVVGPRFIPGTPVSGTQPQDPSLAGRILQPGGGSPGLAPAGGGVQADTDRVPDASRISPPVLKRGQEPGFAVDIEVQLDAGVPIQAIETPNHRCQIARPRPERASILVGPGDGRPDRDFVLRWTVAGEQPQAGVIAHAEDDGKGGTDGHLLLVVEPARLPALAQERGPMDVCFLVDVSGSMRGIPLDLCKTAMREMTGSLRHGDRFQVIAFAGSTEAVFPDYQAVDPATVETAMKRVGGLGGGGGTRMLEGITAALTAPKESGRMRVVVLLTDGFIGNEREIIAATAQRCTQWLRCWVVGIGSAPNRFLVDGVAEVGGGQGVVLGLNDAVKPLTDRLMAKLQKPQLDDLTIDWGGLAVCDRDRDCLGSLWTGSPLVLTARYTAPGRGRVLLRGLVDGVPVTLPVEVDLPARQADNAAVRQAWARRRIEDLERSLDRGNGYRLEDQILALALKHHLASRLTAFVAVDERISVAPGLEPRSVQVAVPLPQGVSELAAGVVPIEMPKGREEAVDGSETGGQGGFMAIGAGGGGSGMFGYRTGGGKRRALARGGGSAGSENAVETGLRFLVRHQSPDGSWDVDGYFAHCTEAPKCEPGRGEADADLAVSARCLLVFLGAGYDHKAPNKHRALVAHGLGWLRGRMTAEGGFPGPILGQALATTVLAEAYALTADPILQPVAQRAVNALLAQRGPAGAWPAQAGGAPDLSATAHALRALRSALSAGLAIGDGLERARTWFTARPVESAEPEAQLAIAVLLGASPGDAVAEALAARATARLADPQYAALAIPALFQLGGARWTTVNGPCRDALTLAQRKGAGCFDGSWDPSLLTGPEAAQGRLLATVYAEAVLQVYYTYSPPPSATGSAPVGR